MPSGGFLKIIFVGIPTYAGMNRFLCQLQLLKPVFMPA